MFQASPRSKDWLPRLAAGEVIGTLAVVETVQQVTPASIEVESTGSTISGKKLIVPDGGIADMAIVLVKDCDGLSMVIADLDE